MEYGSIRHALPQEAEDYADTGGAKHLSLAVMPDELVSEAGFHLMALRVWALLDQPVPVSRIAGRLAGEFGLPREQALSFTHSIVRLFGAAEPRVAGPGHGR